MNYMTAKAGQRGARDLSDWHRAGRLGPGCNGGPGRIGADRHGSTLIEVMVVITLGAVLSGITVAAMGQLFRHDQQATRHVAQRGELQRLAATLRRDLHRASHCQYQAEGARLRLQFDQRLEVVYRRLEDRWVRIATRSDSRGADASAVRTAYGLGQEFACTCTPVQAAQGDLVHIRFGFQSVQPVAAESDNVGVRVDAKAVLSCAVIAVVGRDRMLGQDAEFSP